MRVMLTTIIIKHVLQIGGPANQQLEAPNFCCISMTSAATSEIDSVIVSGREETRRIQEQQRPEEVVLECHDETWKVVTVVV